MATFYKRLEKFLKMQQLALGAGSGGDTTPISRYVVYMSLDLEERSR